MFEFLCVKGCHSLACMRSRCFMVEQNTLGHSLGRGRKGGMNTHAPMVVVVSVCCPLMTWRSLAGV